MRLPPPAGNWSMSIEFTDGHLVYVPDAPTVDEVVALALAAIAVEEGDHGAPVQILPASGRFRMVSRERGAELRADGAEVVDASGLTYTEALRAVGLEPL